MKLKTLSNCSEETNEQKYSIIRSYKIKRTASDANDKSIIPVNTDTPSKNILSEHNADDNIASLGVEVGKCNFSDENFDLL